MTERIADDYSFIAQRLRELEGEKLPAPEVVPVRATSKCYDCNDTGWLTSNATNSGWKRCPYCDASATEQRPPPRIGKQ